MPAHLTPRAGDIVVRQETRQGTLVYVLHTVPGPEQYLIRTREEAVGQALKFAKRAHLRAWLANEDDVVLLGEGQVPKSRKGGVTSAARPAVP